MGSSAEYPPLVVIVGETASGKSRLAVDLAKQFRGEVVAADSRTIYRGLDVSTAKPDVNTMKSVHHHLISILDPDQPYSAAQFKEKAGRIISAVSDRRHVPILVGGTGLYVDALLYNFTFGPKADAQQRVHLNTLDIKTLQARLIEKGIDLPTNNCNQRHLIRALETGGVKSSRSVLRPNTLVLGMAIDREDLKLNIELRVKTMLKEGFVEEIQSVAERYGWDVPALQSPGCQIVKAYGGTCNLKDIETSLIQEHLNIAKRQRTWFRRNKSIHWISKKEEAVDLITTFLNN